MESTPDLKQRQLSTSAKALKLSQYNPDYMQLFIDIHTSCTRALPKQMVLYKHAILLHKLNNEKLPESAWFTLNFQQTTIKRQTKFNIIRSINWKINSNIMRIICILKYLSVFRLQ